MRENLVGVFVSLAALAVACASSGGTTTSATADAARGEVLFASNCAACHGPAAQGTTTGPPLVHEFYVPSHHADAAFQLAVRDGVQPHHWSFGAMPPIPSLAANDVADIVAHVRQLQREAGLIE
jgi:mono/diheme cytochrome c family protein